MSTRNRPSRSVNRSQNHADAGNIDETKSATLRKVGSQAVQDTYDERYHVKAVSMVHSRRAMYINLLLRIRDL